jgi:hypothetical protein
MRALAKDPLFQLPKKVVSGMLGGRMSPPDHLQDSPAQINDIYKPAIIPPIRPSKQCDAEMYDTYKSAMSPTHCPIPPILSLLLRPLFQDPWDCAQQTHWVRL